MIGHGYSRLRVLGCHLMPAAVAFMLGIAAIGFMSDRHSIAVSAVKIVPPLVAPGGTAYAVFKLTDYSHGRCNEGTVHRWLLDSRGIHFTLSDVSVVRIYIPAEAKGLPEHSASVQVDFPVPAGISDGMATYFAHTERWCNPLQRLWPITAHFESSFEVSRTRGGAAPQPNPLEITKP